MIFYVKALVRRLLQRFKGCMKTTLLSEAGRRAGLCVADSNIQRKA